MHYSTVFTKYVQLCNAFTCANTAVTCVLFDEFMCPYTLTETLYSAVTTGPIHSVVTCVLCMISCALTQFHHMLHLHVPLQYIQQTHVLCA